MKSQVLVEITRGATVESRHRGALVVVDCQGSDLHVAGDSGGHVFIRSSVKPFVAALVVASGAADAFGITPRELALIAGSHSGQDEDTELVLGLLRRIGRSEADLRNGSNGPADEATKARMLVAGERPGPARQMCSGEHTGMLAVAAHLGHPTEEYWHESHPVQVAIESLVNRLFRGTEPLERAIDNCAVPTWRASLRSIARAYAWLARPERLPVEFEDWREPLRRVRDAMMANPVQVSGPGELDTDLSATDGIVAKEGAEGLLGIGCVGSGLGIAITIEDGDKTRRAAAVVAIATLSSLRLLDDEPERQLRERHWPPFRDSVGRQVGDARPAFHLPVAE